MRFGSGCLSPGDSCGHCSGVFDFKGLDWSTGLMDSDFCKLNLSINAGQKYGRIWQRGVVVVLLLTFGTL